MPDAKLPAAKVLEASRGVRKNLDEHSKFQVDLERRGIMFGAGPFWDDDETHWSGEGMVIVRAESLAAARAIAAEDPMPTSGARQFTVRPWLLNEGTLTFRLNFSDMKYLIE